MPARKDPGAPVKPNLYVVARFLDCLARPDRTWTRTQLQAAVGVNFDILRRYLDFLERKGYARVIPSSEGADVVRLTAEGRNVRQELRGVLNRFLADDGAGEASAGAASSRAAAPGTRP